MVEPVFRGFNRWFRGCDREEGGVECDRRLEGCVSEHVSVAHKEKIVLELTA